MLQQTPGFSQTSETVDNIPGLFLLSRRGNAPTGFMDQQIPGLDRDFQKVAGSRSQPIRLPGLGHHSQRRVDIAPGLLPLSQREEAPTAMDQHSQRIPGLDRYSRKVAGVISGLSRREKPDLGCASQPIQMLGLNHNSQQRMASDIAPGLLLLSRRDDAPTDFMVSQQIPGLAPHPRKIPRLSKLSQPKSPCTNEHLQPPGQHAHQGVTSDMASGVSRGGKELMDQRLQEVPRCGRVDWSLSVCTCLAVARSRLNTAGSLVSDIRKNPNAMRGEALSWKKFGVVVGLTARRREKNKRRKQKLLEEQQWASVSTPVPLPTPAAPLPTSSRSIFVNGVYASDHPFWDGFPSFSYDENGDRIDDEYDEPTAASTHPLACSPTTHPPPSTYTPRDLSALRTTHPWRTIRRRNHRLLPQHREPRPFPQSLPKRTVVSAPRPNILALKEDIPVSPLLEAPLVPPVVAPPLPLPPPPHEPHLDGLPLRPINLLDLQQLHHGYSIHPDDVPPLDMPAPSLCPCPADHSPPSPPIAPAPLPILTPILPAVLLSHVRMSREFVELEPVFAEFLHPAIVNFVNGWVTHCRQQDSFG
ncbi:hypothetical protein B0H14DRAFT_3160785 [Mycena olivaceomarginata]|nr:hypothetical protein B0H14DRAFT_3160785 [Mycena olivaceomarginata]